MRQSYRGLAIAGIFSLFCTFGTLVSSAYAAAAGGGGVSNTGTWTTLAMPGTTNISPVGISGNNVVGFYDDDASGKVHGFLYNIATATWTTLDVPGAVVTYLNGIDGNNIVGISTAGGGFLYNGTSWRILRMPGVAGNINPASISGSNIVGNYLDASKHQHGFLYDGTTWTTLNAPGATDTLPTGISGNNIVGYYTNDNASTTAYHGFLYNGTSWTTLDTPGAIWTIVNGISGNNVVGFSSLGNFLYNGTSWDHLDMPGHANPALEGIDGNNIVGSFLDLAGPHGFRPQGFLYTMPTGGGDSGTEWHLAGDATGGDCSSIGTWDGQTKTCTLTQDLSQEIIIDSDKVILDGNGRTITGPDNNTGNGVDLSGRSGVTIKNLNVKNFDVGILLADANNNTLIRITSSNNLSYGIFLKSSDSNTLADNTAFNNGLGIALDLSNGNMLAGNTTSNNANGIISLGFSNTFTGNTATNNHIGIYLSGSSSTLTANTSSNNLDYGILLINSSNNNTLSGNTVSNNQLAGIRLHSSSSNRIYHNNFISNATQVSFDTTDNVDNVFNLASPTGGNYWSDYDAPAEGCNNANADNFCDAPYTFTGGQDNLPWTKIDGWLASTTPTSSPVSFTLNGNGSSFHPAFNKDGRFVAFGSEASNFVPNDTNGKSDMFVFDRSNGVFDRVSVSSNGAQSNAGAGGRGMLIQSMSDDGRFVVFNSSDSNLVAGDTNGMSDVFLHDRQTGETTRVSVASDGTEGNNNSHSEAISSSGRFIIFTSLAPNLVPGDTNGTDYGFDVFVHDRQTGTTERVSIGPNGEQSTVGSGHPSISADGRFVAFYSSSPNWHNDNSSSDVYVRDRFTQTTERISIPVSPTAFNGSGGPIISADSRYVAFPSNATFVDADSPNGNQVLVHDRLLGTMTIASVSSDGVQAQAMNGASLLSMSDDGRYVLFITRDPNLAPNPSTGEFHLYVRDLTASTTARVASGANGGSISGDGRFIAFFNSDLSVGSRADIFIGVNPLFEQGSGNQPATLTVIKKVINDNGGKKNVSDFPLFIAQGAAATPVESGIANEVSPGTYKATERNASGYSWSFSGDCDASGFVTIAPGDHKTCIITNNDALILSQLSASHPGGIPEGSSIADSAVTFTGQLKDPNNLVPIQMEVELRQFAEPFTGKDDGGILVSTPVPAGSTATITRSGLVPGAYHWRARIFGGSEPLTQRTEFGAVGNADFSIAREYEPIQPVLGHSVCDYSARNLVFITHGWNGNAEGWVRVMAESIRGHLSQAHLNDWAVCTFDWRKSAEGLPQSAYLEAETQGEYLGQFLVAHQYDSIHFIAHSAGSNLIQTAADWIQPRSPGTKIHLTFLDAYQPAGAAFSDYGLDPRNRNDSYTIHSDWWAEQYVDMRNAPIALGIIDIRDTNYILPDAYNFDVTEVDPIQDPTLVEKGQISGLDYAVRVHGWPIDWYKTSIVMSSAPHGFRHSLEAGGIQRLPVVQFPPGQCVKLKMNNVETLCTVPGFFGFTSTYIPVIHVQDAAAGGAAQSGGGGTVAYTDSTSAILRTGSPVWLDITATTTQEINSLRFEYSFLSNAGSEGVVSIFADGQLKHKIDERIALAGLNNARDIWLGSLTPGTHIITFRLDPFTDVQSVVLISNIQLGLIERNEVVDTLPPSTTAIVSGTLWKNGWHVGTTTTIFTAEDNSGGVGVAKTEYSLNAGNTWITYASTSPLMITTEGTTTITYRTIDHLGNTETSKTLTFKIVSVKSFLEDALAKLGSINTGNNDIDKATDAVERDLEKIIADTVWLDRNRLSLRGGQSTLISEVGIVKALGDILNKAGQGQRRSNATGVTEALYRNVQSEIVQSSALLAQLSLNEAKNSQANNAIEQRLLDRRMINIQNMIDRASAMEARSPAQAVSLYGSAWFAAEALLETPGTTSFRASDFGALYLPSDMKDLMDSR